jgi:hypothetical protein
LGADLLKLFERVATLESEYWWIKWYLIVAIPSVVAFVLTLYFTARKSISKRTIKIVTDQTKKGLKAIFEQKSNEMDETLHYAKDQLQVLNLLIENYKTDPSKSLFLNRIETGEFTIKFENTNYLSDWKKFDKEFSNVPLVFLTEGLSGDWAYMKVDEKSKSGFRWASRTLSGQQVTYETKLQYLAIESIESIDNVVKPLPNNE